MQVHLLLGSVFGGAGPEVGVSTTKFVCADAYRIWPGIWGPMSESWNAESDLGPGTMFSKARFICVSPIPLEDGSGALELPALLTSGRELFWAKSFLARSREVLVDGE